MPSTFNTSSRETSTPYISLIATRIDEGSFPPRDNIGIAILAFRESLVVMRGAVGAGGSPSIDEGAVEVDDVEEIEVLLASDDDEGVIESL